MSTQPLPDSPFVGLRPFRRAESLLFFGRRQQTVELLDRLHRARFMPVVGSSGCGKSSLVRAGLVPNLEAGFLVEDRDRWLSATMKPGDAPLENLAAAVLSMTTTSVDPPDSVRFSNEIRSSGAQAIVEKLAPALDQADANCLLLVDQFEELFRFGLRSEQPERRDEATDFVSILLALADQRSTPIYVVMTMRSDFLGDCDAFYGLPEAMNRSQYLVPRLTRQQRREAIEGPVRLYGEAITPQLLDRLLNDAGDESDQLPVMQHALLRTWENWRQNGSGPIDLANYQAIGTQKEALARDADEALQGMSAEELKLTTRLFQALTETDAANRPIRRPARLSELEGVTGASRAQVMEIVERFRGHGRSFLVVSEDKTRGDALIDICHESLIRQWKTLREWVDQEVRSGKLYRRVADSAERHAAGQEGAWRDPQLQLALEEKENSGWNLPWAARYGGSFEQAMAFLELSLKERDREAQAKAKQQRVMRAMTVGFLTLSVIVLAAFLVLARKIKHDAEEAAKSTVRKAKMEADESLYRAQIATSAAKSEASFAESAFNTARQEKANAEADHRRLMGLRLGTQALSQFASSADGLAQSGMLAIESLKAEPTFEGRKALAQVLRLIPPPPRIYKAHQGPVQALAFSRDGRWMASVGDDRTVILWDVANQMNKIVLETQLPTAPSESGLAFSWDGRWLAAGGMGALRIWETASRKLVQQLDSSVQGFVRSVAFSPDGTRLAIAGQDGAKLFQRSGDKWGEERSFPAIRVNAAVFLNDASWALAGFLTGPQRYGAWVTDFTLTGQMPIPASAGQLCYDLSLSGDSLTLAARCDGDVLIAERPESKLDFQASRQLQPASFTTRIAISHDGQQVACASQEDIHVVSSHDGEDRALLTSRTDSVAFRPDGRALGAGQDDGSIAMWPTSRGTEAVLVPFEGVAAGLAFGMDERLLVMREDGNIRAFDTPGADKVLLAESLQIGVRLGNPTSSPDGRFVAAYDDKTLYLILTKPLRSVSHFEVPGAKMLAFIPDRSTLLAIAEDGIHRVDLSTMKEKAVIRGDFRTLKFSSDGRLLATLQQQIGHGHHYVSEMRVWRLTDGEEVAWKETGRQASDGPASRASQGGPQNLIDEIRNWELAADKSLSPDRQWRFGLSRSSSTLVLYEASSRRQVAKLEHDGDLLDAAFSSKGRWLATSSKDGTVRLWPLLQAEDMIERACQLLPRNLTPDEWKELKLEGPYRKTCMKLP